MSGGCGRARHHSGRGRAAFARRRRMAGARTIVRFRVVPGWRSVRASKRSAARSSAGRIRRPAAASEVIVGLTIGSRVAERRRGALRHRLFV